MSKIRQKGVFISILNQGEVRVENANLAGMFLRNDRYKVFIDYPSDKPISNNRNKIVQKFLNSGLDYLLMIDDDVTPPANVLDILDFLADKEVDIASPVMFTMQKREVATLAVRRTKDGKYTTIDLKDKDGLLEVDATGTGCIFIKREVLENPEMKSPFMNYYDTDGVKTTGLDFNFCTRAKKLGYGVFVHLDYVAGHFATVDLKDIFELTTENRLLKEELAKQLDSPSKK